MTGKQLIVLALLISANYIYFSFKHISQELSNDNHSNTPLLNSDEKSNTTTEILKQITVQVKELETPSVNIEKKVIEVIEAVQATKKTPTQVKKVPVEKPIIKQPIEKKLSNNLESEIEAALKGISTSQSIDK